LRLSHRPTKLRRAFLSRLCGGASLYVINDAALDDRKERGLPRSSLANFPEPRRPAAALQALDLSALKVTPHSLLIAGEGAVWGVVRHRQNRRNDARQPAQTPSWR
jgi:hypothetical protein